MSIEGAGPSGGDDLDVVSGVQADPAVAQLSFAPALLVLLSQLQQLFTWKEDDRKDDGGDVGEKDPSDWLFTNLNGRLK